MKVYMADKSLIQGAGQVYSSQGFVDYGKAYKPSSLLNAYSKILQEQEKEKQEIDAITTKVNNRMNSMNTVDLTDITFEQKTVVKDYLVEQRNIYAQAANEIAYISDKSSSEYQYYADIMSEVNNNISNLSEQLKDYKEAKIQYESDNDKRLWSGGVGNAAAQADAASVYGFDEDNMATLQIANGGNMQFVYSGKTVNWNDHQDPYLKHFTTAKYITDKANTIAASNSELTAENANTIRLELDQKLSDEQALKSLIAGDFMYEGIDLSDIVYNEEDPNSTKIEVIDRLVNGFKAVGARSKAAYNEEDGNLYSRYKKPETVQAMMQAQQSAREEGALIGAQEPPNVSGQEAKVFKFGPNDNPDQIRIKLDPITKKWVYFNSKTAVKSEYDDLLDLMNSHPGLFYTNN
jgi:hypothetical protein|tara:strand:+ start:2294 stop:3511 length:1218 start_codon:yes stop_codon:yes gene_type:complete